MKRFSIMLLVSLCVVLSSTALASTMVTITNDKWVPATGTWAVSGLGYAQTDTEMVNTNAYFAVTQNEASLKYQWTVEFKETSLSWGPAVGMYLLASEGDAIQRGNAYLVFTNKTNVQLYRGQDNTLAELVRFENVDFELNKPYSFSVDINTQTGLISIFVDGVEVGNFTDSEPIQTGSFVSLRTRGTSAVFSNVKVSSK